MKAVEFAEQSFVLAKDQPEYQPLPVHVGPAPEEPATCCLELDDQEIEEIIRTRRVWITQWTFGNLYHPIRMSVSKPDF